MKKFLAMLTTALVITITTFAQTTIATSPDGKTTITTTKVVNATSITTSSVINGSQVITTEHYKRSKLKDWNVVVMDKGGKVIFKNGSYNGGSYPGYVYYRNPTTWVHVGVYAKPYYYKRKNYYWQHGGQGHVRPYNYPPFRRS